jgi:pyrroline-5-carboxylate reductase
VSREESAKKLRGIFDALGELGQSVEILTGRNVDGVKNADVVLLW